ncbi:electron transport protein SCO1/SenC [Arcticibacter svalbardensis MN12-7]|uniref:Electron transport protein SCO1/SenC n=2 Tax=Arcticibacter TaxID=1288026 RepID=R9GVK5_9SPHI|nr:electron transport protein SCO1/SenC [Arcticibacter svalbardensis MN12-7]
MLTLLYSCNHSEKVITNKKETLPFYNTADFDAEWIDEKDSSYKKIHTIDSFSLQSQLGNVITKDSLDGNIYVANFFFSICPSICPKMTNNFKTLQDSFINNKQIKLVSFSVMPWVDSVKVLNEYAKRNHINPSKWYLLTGDKEEIYHLARTSFFAEKGLGLQKNSDEFLHTESMLLIDKKGRIRGIYNATQKPDIERVVDDIKVLMKE